LDLCLAYCIKTFL